MVDTFKGSPPPKKKKSAEKKLFSQILIDVQSYGSAYLTIYLCIYLFKLFVFSLALIWTGQFAGPESPRPIGWFGSLIKTSTN
jgi:hypothetical protein